MEVSRIYGCRSTTYGQQWKHPKILELIERVGPIAFQNNDPRVIVTPIADFAEYICQKKCSSAQDAPFSITHNLRQAIVRNMSVLQQLELCALFSCFIRVHQGATIKSSKADIRALACRSPPFGLLWTLALRSTHRACVCLKKLPQYVQLRGRAS